MDNNKFTRDTPLKMLLSDWWPFKLTLKSWDLLSTYFFFLRMFYMYLVKTPHVDSSIMGNALFSIWIISSHRNSRGRPCKSNCCWFRCWTAWRFFISFWSNICHILLSRVKNDPKQTLKIIQQKRLLCFISLGPKDPISSSRVLRPKLSTF